MLDDHRDLIANPRQRRRERGERHIPVLARPRRVEIAVGGGGGGGCSSHPSDAYLRPDRRVHFRVDLAVGETRHRAAGGGGTLLQRGGVLFEALADRVELGRVERFGDFRLVVVGGGGGGGGGVEEVGPARAGVLLLEVEREKAVGLRAVRVPGPEARRGRDAAPEARGGVTRGRGGGVRALHQERERLRGEEDGDVRFGRAGREGKRDRDLLRVLRPRVRWRFWWGGGGGGGSAVVVVV